MKRAIIVHCWGGNFQYAWYQSVANRLQHRGFHVTVPNMPDTDAPDLKKWLPHLIGVIGEPDEELVLIGHSIGTVTIMRYLESLPEGKKVGKVVLVAGFTDQLGFQELGNFFETRLDFAKIKNKSKHGFVVIQSDNDPYVPLKYGKQLKDYLGAKLIIKHNAGHMSGAVDDEDACVELPEVVDVL